MRSPELGFYGWMTAAAAAAPSVSLKHLDSRCEVLETQVLQPLERNEGDNHAFNFSEKFKT